MNIVRRMLRVLLVIVLCVVLLAGAYLIYAFTAFHRIGDMDLSVTNRADGSFSVGEEYKVISYNIGFAAYEQDYDFFMDGGKQSWAWSAEHVLSNMQSISDFLVSENADIYSIQEVDFNSTRSYHINEAEILKNQLSTYSVVEAQNYDSPFLFYPFTQPHGKSQSELMTFANAAISEGKRHELPIEDGFTKMLDLDRCYSTSRMTVDNGKELVFYNMHLSAYTSDGKIAYEQLKLMLSDMQSEYEKGNYCIAAGDFNKDLLGNSSQYFGQADEVYTWAQPIPESTFDNLNIGIVVPFDEANPVPSARNADAPYHPGQFVVTIDGFLATDNVETTASNVIDLQFMQSDHNPTYMTFILK